MYTPTKQDITDAALLVAARDNYHGAEVVGEPIPFKKPGDVTIAHWRVTMCAMKEDLQGNSIAVRLLSIVNQTSGSVYGETCTELPWRR